MYSQITNQAGVNYYTVGTQTKGLSQLLTDVVSKIFWLLKIGMDLDKNATPIKQLVTAGASVVPGLTSYSPYRMITGSDFDPNSLVSAPADHGGSFPAINMMNTAAKDALDYAGLLSASETRIINDLVGKAVIDSNAIPGVDATAKTAYEDKILNDMKLFNEDYAANNVSIAARLVTLNASLEAAVLQAYQNARADVSNVVTSMRSTNKTLVASERAILPQLASLASSLAAMKFVPPASGISLIDQTKLTAAATKLQGLLDDSKTSFGRTVTSAMSTKNSTFNQGVQRAALALVSSLNHLASTLNVGGFNATMASLFNRTNSSALSQQASIQSLLHSVETAASGRAAELLDGQTSETIISDYVSNQLGDSTTMQEEASTLKNEIGNAETALLAELQDTSGKTASSFFTNTMTAVRDVSKQRDAMLEASQANFNSMQSAMAGLASSVGMTLEEFESQLIQAQEAMQALQSSSNSLMTGGATNATGEAAKMLSSIGTSLEGATASLTAGASSGAAATSGLNGAADGYGNKASDSANTQGAATNGKVSGATSSLGNTNQDVTGDLTKRASNTTNTMSTASSALNSANKGANYAASQLSITMAESLRAIAAAAALISPAFTTLQSNVADIKGATSQRMADRIAKAESDKTADVGSGAATVIKELKEGVDDKLRDLSAASTSDLHPVTDAVSGAIEAKRGLQVGYWYDAYSSFAEKARQADITLQTLIGTAAIARSGAHGALLQEYVDKADALRKSAGLLVSTDKGVIDGYTNTYKTYLGQEGANNRTLTAYLNNETNLVQTVSDNYQFTKDLILYLEAAASKDNNYTVSMSRMNESGVAAVADMRAKFLSNLSSLYPVLAIRKQSMMADFTGNLSTISKIVSDAETGDKTKDSVNNATSMQVATNISNLVTAVGQFIDKRTQQVQSYLANATIQADLSTLLPFFGLSEDSRMYARTVLANVSQAELTSQAVTATSASLMSNTYDTAKAAQSQSSAALESKRIQSELVTAGTDFAMQQNEELADQTADSVKYAMAGLNAAATKGLRAGQARAEAAAAEASGASADLHVDMARALGSLASGLSGSFMSITNTSIKAAAPAQRLIANIASTIQQFSQLQVAQRGNDVVSQVEAESATLLAAVIANAVRDEGRVAESLKQAMRSANVVQKAASSVDLLAGAADAATVPLGVVRSEIASKQKSSISDIEHSIAEILSDRRHAAVQRVLEVYSSINSALGNFKGKTDRLKRVTA